MKRTGICLYLILIIVLAIAGTQVLNALHNYFQIVQEDGDYLNDWLTHLPGVIRPLVQDLGEQQVERTQARISEKLEQLRERGRAQ